MKFLEASLIMQMGEKNFSSRNKPETSKAFFPFSRQETNCTEKSKAQVEKPPRENFFSERDGVF